jgi:cullin-associated NEDD8-dissociated protein 1
MKTGFDYKPFVKDLHKVTLEKLKAMDIDQEVKEGAITAMGLIVAILADELIKSQLDETLKILAERLKNEITRLTAVRTFTQIASSPLRVDLTSVLGEVLMELATFLRKQNRQLKQAALSALLVFVQNYSKEKALISMCDNILKEDAALINDSDLHLSHLALKLVTLILQLNPNAASTIQTIVLPHCLELLKSSLLQGLALEVFFNYLS